MKISGFCVEILNRMAEQNDRELDIVDIDAEMEEIDAVNWEEFVIMTAYIAECHAFNRPFKQDDYSSERTRNKMVDLFVSMLQFT